MHWGTVFGDDVLAAAILDRFPFRIPYQITREDIVVLALAHTSRRPDYWGRDAMPGLTDTVPARTVSHDARSPTRAIGAARQAAIGRLAPVFSANREAVARSFVRLVFELQRSRQFRTD
jgi:hypothetical protein